MTATQSAAGAIGRIRYTHDAMIDLIIAEPELSQGHIALRFGYTEGWISRIFCSDAFQARLGERRKEVVDPILAASIEERLRGLIVQSTEVLAEKISASRNPDLALRTLDVAAKALGFGARNTGPVINNSFVVALPPKIVNAQEWAQQHGRQPVVINATVEGA